MILRYSWNTCDPKKLHPKHQGNPPPETVSVRGPSGWVLQTDLVANLCCRSPGVTDEANGKVWCHSRKSSPKGDDFPYLFFQWLFVICSARKSIPCSARKSMLYKTCFPTKIPTAHPLLHGFIFSGPWTVVSVSLHMQKGTQGAKFYIPQWPSSTILLRLSDHEKPAFRNPKDFYGNPQALQVSAAFHTILITSKGFWIWVAGGFTCLEDPIRRNPLSLKSLLTQKWHKNWNLNPLIFPKQMIWGISINFIHLKKYPDSHWRPQVYSMKPGSSRAYAPSIDTETTKTTIKCMVANFF